MGNDDAIVAVERLVDKLNTNLSSATPTIGAKDATTLLKQHQQGIKEEGDRVERREIREAEERREIRKLAVAAVSFAITAAVVFTLVRALPENKQPDAVEKILTAFLGAIPGALAGYLFGKDDKKAKGDKAE